VRWAVRSMWSSNVALRGSTLGVWRWWLAWQMPYFPYLK